MEKNKTKQKTLFPTFGSLRSFFIVPLGIFINLSIQQRKNISYHCPFDIEYIVICSQETQPGVEIQGGWGIYPFHFLTWGMAHVINPHSPFFPMSENLQEECVKIQQI